MQTFTFESETVLDYPLDQVFAFFSDASNLSRLMPTSMEFKIQTPTPIAMKPGVKISYALKVKGIPLKWVSLISAWEPGVRFVDEQIKGPYRYWKHEHVFVAEGDKTRVKDHIIYAPPGGFLSPIINQLIVKKEVDAIFSHRTKMITEIFPPR